MSSAEKVSLALRRAQVEQGEMSEHGPKADSDLEAANVILAALPTPVFSILDYRLLWVGFLLGVVAAVMDFIGSGAPHRIVADVPPRISITACLHGSSDPHVDDTGTDDSSRMSSRVKATAR
jgi:hypothetical protein